MKRLRRQKFWWPGMVKDIVEKYQACKECKNQAISKLQKKVEIRPLFLDSLAPGQIIHLDYLEFD